MKSKRKPPRKITPTYHVDWERPDDPQECASYEEALQQARHLLHSTEEPGIVIVRADVAYVEIEQTTQLKITTVSTGRVTVEDV